MKKAKIWLISFLIGALVLTMGIGGSAEARGAKGNGGGPDRDRGPGNGNKPLTQWEAVGYAAGIAGWVDEDEDFEDLSKRELKALTNDYLDDMKTKGWLTGKFIPNKPAKNACFGLYRFPSYSLVQACWAEARY